MWCTCCRTGEVDVPVAEVMVGDRLVVRPGESIPADGVVTRNDAGGWIDAHPASRCRWRAELGGRLTGGSSDGDGRIVLRCRCRRWGLEPCWPRSSA